MLRSFCLFALTVVAVTLPVQAQIATHVVISEVYGGGGNTGSTWRNDFIELYNPTSAPVNITGWSVQYASATGTPWSLTVLSGTIAPKGFYLVQQAAGAGGTVNLPTPDAVGTLALSATNGKVALASNSAAITGLSDPDVVDFIGYGTTANAFEGSGPAPTLSNTTSAERKADSASTALSLGPGGGQQFSGNGWDSNNNSTDFVAQTAITPQNSLGSIEPPVPPVAGTGSAAVRPRFFAAGAPSGFSLVVYPDSLADITKVRFVVPAIFSWSQNISDVSVFAYGSPVTIVQGDTITVLGILAAEADSITISVANLTAPDTTVGLVLDVRTAAGIDSTALVKFPPTLVVYGSARPIADVRTNGADGVPLLVNAYVTVRGVVTVSNQFQGPAYLQDVSGGLAVFDAAFEASVSIGDEVTVTGWIDQFRGLTELRDAFLHQIHGSGNDIQPIEVSAAAVSGDGFGGLEIYEGGLVRLNLVQLTQLDGVTPVATWDAGTSGKNYLLTDQTGTVQIRIDNNVDFAGSPAPQTAFDVIGVVGQFIQTPPYIGGYQIFPRRAGDILASGPIFAESPHEIDIAPRSMRILWTTVNPGSSGLRYGRTLSYESGSVADTGLKTSHDLLMTGLDPATIYYVQAFSAAAGDTSTAGTIVVSTASEGSSGQIIAYFNKSVDASVARSEIALGNQDLVQRIVTRIDSAHSSIDVCLYSLSGTPGPGDTVADALIRARQRGVSIRVIGEKDNQSTAPWTKLRNAGIPVIDDAFDVVNAGIGLMHNKFFVVDGRDTTSSADDWVWTGSWNVTESGTYSDMQNVLGIQDQALARAYTLEFNEMWGSATDVPNASLARFGSRKRDNTPHHFVIGTTPLELYFSPSDRTTQQIIRQISGAQGSVNAALLTFTRSDIASALVARHGAGVRARVMLDNSTDSGSQFAFLTSNGVETLVDPSSAFLHHKYAIIDAEDTALDGVIITGSHNWSSSAENSNNENTLVIRSDRVANLYLQEFKARYADAGGTDTLVVGIRDRTSEVPGQFELSQNFPNPFNPSTRLTLSVPGREHVTVEVYDLLGRRVAQLVAGVLSPGIHTVEWNASGVASGVYLCRAVTGGHSVTRKMLLLP